MNKDWNTNSHMENKESDTSGPTIRNRDIFDLKTQLAQRQYMLWNVLHERYKYNTSIKRSQNFLLKHIDSKLSIIVMYADLVGSTKMSMELPVEKMAMIIKVFSHELS